MHTTTISMEYNFVEYIHISDGQALGVPKKTSNIAKKGAQQMARRTSVASVSSLTSVVSHKSSTSAGSLKSLLSAGSHKPSTSTGSHKSSISTGSRKTLNLVGSLKSPVPAALASNVSMKSTSDSSSVPKKSVSSAEKEKVCLAKQNNSIFVYFHEFH